MKKLKTIFLACFSILIVCAVCGLAVSCQNDVNVQLEEEEAIDAQVFNASFSENCNLFMEHEVTVDSAQLAASALSTRAQPITTYQIYLDSPIDDKPLNLNTVKTPKQIYDLVKTRGVELSKTYKSDTRYVLNISKEESEAALNPLILESKRYLRGKGFSDREISQMLAENNADESILVPFVMVLVEEELKSGTRADLATAISCAKHAIGVDILTSIGQSTAKTWSKAVLKKVFKTVASKVLGPVGVIIGVIDFALCMDGIVI
ncbi:MAG: hypothetical protein K2J63_07535 [Muribaculaceae bacterium]|nr:hypothetical protein [Muribaculaceae bacterium]MDE6795143.1 hypothetical protein [Muribaculaceae bacterium]